MEHTVDNASTDHDEGLVDWFLSLEPDQRLAELQSRVAFFNRVMPNDVARLPADPGTA